MVTLIVPDLPPDTEKWAAIVGAGAAVISAVAAVASLFFTDAWANRRRFRKRPLMPTSSRSSPPPQPSANQPAAPNPKLWRRRQIGTILHTIAWVFLAPMFLWITIRMDQFGPVPSVATGLALTLVLLASATWGMESLSAEENEAARAREEPTDDRRG